MKRISTKQQALVPKKRKEEVNKESSSLDHEISIYYCTLLNRLHAPFEDPEEKDIFMKNCLKQTIGEELKIIQDDNGGPFIFLCLQQEQFKSSDVRRFCEATLQDLPGIIANPNGSRVVEYLLIAALRSAQTEDEFREEHLGWIETVAENVLSNLEDVWTGVYGSFVLCRLCRVLAGKSVPYDLKKKLAIQDIETKPDPIPPFEEFDFKVNETFGKLLKKIVQKIFKNEKLLEYADDKLTSSVLRDLIAVMAVAKPKHCQLIIRKLIKVLLPKDCSVFPETVTNDIPNFLLRQAIVDSDEEVLNEIVEHLLPHLEAICCDKSANITLQLLIVCCKSKEQFERIFDAVIPHMNVFYSLGFYAYFTNLSHGCVLLDACQAKFTKIIHDFLKVPSSDNNKGEFVSQLLTMKTYFTENKESFIEHEITIYGSRTVQNMLNFHKPHKVVGSILSLSASELCHIGKDKHGAYVFGVFFKSGYIGVKKHQHLLDNLKPIMRELAGDKTGRSMLLNVFKAVPIKMKTQIAEVLCCKELERNFVYYKLNLLTFKLRRPDWIEAQNRLQVKQDIVKEVFKSASIET